MYEVISTGSHGNAVKYGSVLVDCGVSFAKIKPFLGEISLVLLTHEHSDHLNVKTLKMMLSERPALRIGCGNFLLDKLKSINPKNIDILDGGRMYLYSQLIIISPVLLYHDVPNIGYRIFIRDKKIFHATDTAHLKGITAIGYDLYAIEFNHDAEVSEQRIAEKKAAGKFAYEVGAMNSHLSEQQAKEWLFKNATTNSQVLRLHESKTNF